MVLSFSVNLKHIKTKVLKKSRFKSTEFILKTNFKKYLYTNWGLFFIFLHKRKASLGSVWAPLFPKTCVTLSSPRLCPTPSVLAWVWLLLLILLGCTLFFKRFRLEFLAEAVSVGNVPLLSCSTSSFLPGKCPLKPRHLWCHQLNAPPPQTQTPLVSSTLPQKGKVWCCCIDSPSSEKLGQEGDVTAQRDTWEMRVSLISQEEVSLKNNPELCPNGWKFDKTHFPVDIWGGKVCPSRIRHTSVVPLSQGLEFLELFPAPAHVSTPSLGLLGQRKVKYCEDASVQKKLKLKSYEAKSPNSWSCWLSSTFLKRILLFVRASQALVKELMRWPSSEKGGK